MADIDDETVARVLQWCAAAGRRASPAEVRAALSSLSWDGLLAARAAVADDPPARPLGPFALADIARGVPPDMAAERERSGAYGAPAAAEVPAAADLQPGSAEAPPAPPEKRAKRGRGTRRVATVVIRRARDRRQEDAATAAPERPLVDELFLSEGRAVVERWIRRHGARRARVAEELARWRRADGTPAGEDDLRRLLDEHGLTRGFERRERAEVLHAMRAAGGQIGAAARALGMTPASLQEAARRLGIAADVESVRDERRDEIRRRGTLGDRVRLLVDEADRIDDLGMTGEIEADLRERLREHVRALRAAHARNLEAALARTLGITREQSEAMAVRFRLDVRDASSAPARREGPPAAAARAAPRGHEPRRHGSARGQGSASARSAPRGPQRAPGGGASAGSRGRPKPQRGTPGGERRDRPRPTKPRRGR